MLLLRVALAQSPVITSVCTLGEWSWGRWEVGRDSPLEQSGLGKVSFRANGMLIIFNGLVRLALKLKCHFQASLRFSGEWRGGVEMEGGRGGGRGTRITTTKFDLPGAASPILAGELPPGQGERWLRAHPARHPRGEREQCFGGEGKCPSPKLSAASNAGLR